MVWEIMSLEIRKQTRDFLILILQVVMSIDYDKQESTAIANSPWKRNTKMTCAIKLQPFRTSKPPNHKIINPQSSDNMYTQCMRIVVIS